MTLANSLIEVDNSRLDNGIFYETTRRHVTERHSDNLTSL